MLRTRGVQRAAPLELRCTATGVQVAGGIVIRAVRSYVPDDEPLEFAGYSFSWMRVTTLASAALTMCAQIGERGPRSGAERGLPREPSSLRVCAAATTYPAILDTTAGVSAKVGTSRAPPGGPRYTCAASLFVRDVQVEQDKPLVDARTLPRKSPAGHRDRNALVDEGKGGKPQVPDCFPIAAAGRDG